uniref:ABC transporter ATP-binding protein n=1 Tax=Pseudoxanthobacter sp. TaxID=1925742 RepID=UPI002FE1B9D7
QHFRLVPRFTVAENIRLAALPARRRALRRRSDIAAFAQHCGLPVDPDAVTGELPLAMQQRVEILKALVNRADLLVLDEPTTILTPAEAETLYASLRRLAGGGTAVAVVTHHLSEVMAHADRVSVIRLGRLISTGPLAGRSREDLIGDIVGRTLNVDAPFLPARAPGAPALVARGLTIAPRPSSSGLQDFSLEVAAGEVVGIAGVEGNGQRELFEVLTGLARPQAGRLTLGGHPLGAGHVDPAQVGAVPEDRHHEGLVMDLSIAANMVLPRVGQRPFSRFGWLARRAIGAEAARLAESFDVRNGGLSLTPRTLSGGNQQKIVLARALGDAAPLVVVHQPTRGLDVLASEDVLRRLRASADAGRAVVAISSNLSELMRLCDRIVVLLAGRITGTLSRAEATPERLGALLTGSLPPAAAPQEAR